MSKSIQEYTRSEGVRLLSKISFDKNIIKAIQNSKSIIEYDYSYKERFIDIWNEIQNTLLN
jgi:MinD superfamily P-loop ATPase